MRWQVRRFLEVVREEGLLSAAKKGYQYTKLDVFGMNNDLVYEIPDRLYRPIFERRHGPALDVMEKDWDNLVILDAYRYDVFEEHSRFEGELERHFTHGNWSLEWVLRNFEGEDLSDTVCVSGNVFYERLGQETLYTLRSLGRDPETITETAIEFDEEYPDKRLIVHYMTPHIPHRGEIGRELAGEGEEFADVFELCKDGEITEETVWESYLENVEIAESHAERLLEHLEGKTVITSDHGENLGERQFGLRRFDHGHETEECRFVPWLELPFEERKTVEKGEPEGYEYADDGVMTDRLEALGYM